MTAKLTSIIPNLPSDLYPTFGVDVLTAIDPANDDYDTQPVEWLEGGTFSDDWRGDADELADAAGYRIDWLTVDYQVSSDYVQVDIERR